MTRLAQFPAFLASALLATFALGVRADDLTGRDELPGAATLDKVTWTTSVGLTRLRFHGSGVQAPRISRPHPSQLVVDLTAASASGLGASLGVGTPEVVAIRKLPPSMSVLLPADVSERLFVELASAETAWSLESDADGFTIFAGEQEKAEARRMVFDDGGTYAQSFEEARLAPSVMQPDRAEMLERPFGVRVSSDQALRVAPSALAAESGVIRAGETRLADARRGDWVHLTSGGWMRHSSTAPPTELPSRSKPSRSPVAWSVVTLGTGLAIEVSEVLAGAQPRAESLRARFRDPLTLLRLRVLVPNSTPYSFTLPPKRGRLQVRMTDGSMVESLGLDDVVLARPSDAAVVAGALEAESLGEGAQWETYLLLPPGFDALAASEPRIDVGGQRHLLFRVPGSGELDSGDGG